MAKTARMDRRRVPMIVLMQCVCCEEDDDG